MPADNPILSDLRRQVSELTRRAPAVQPPSTPQEWLIVIVAELDGLLRRMHAAIDSLQGVRWTEEEKVAFEAEFGAAVEMAQALQDAEAAGRAFLTGAMSPNDALAAMVNALERLGANPERIAAMFNPPTAN